MSDEIVQCRIDSRVKDKAKQILKQKGLTMSDAIRLFLDRVISKKGLPFQASIPNKKTIAAIKELQSGKGLKVVTLDQLFKECGKAAESARFSSKKKIKKFVKKTRKKP